MNLLFICSRNQWRSPTAEKIFSKNSTYKTRSCGTSLKAKKKVSQKDIDWAHVIFVMEKKHKTMICSGFDIQNKEVHILDIPDEYKFMDSELIQTLKETVNPILDQFR